jgi:hypothetical protein
MMAIIPIILLILLCFCLAFWQEFLNGLDLLLENMADFTRNIRDWLRKVERRLRERINDNPKSKNDD